MNKYILETPAANPVLRLVEFKRFCNFNFVNTIAFEITARGGLGSYIFFQSISLFHI